MDIGLGWVIIKSEGGYTWYWHNGGTGGYTSSIVIDVESKKGVVILSNISAFHPSARNIDQLSFNLLKEITQK